MALTYVTHERISLKSHPEFNENWLQDRIAEAPTILGLGKLELLARERRQDKAGRLDLLLAEPDEDRRYEVELQLGPTDETHIIRCIEYWDIERRRYPQYDHCAVLVAEDVTSRFLNVLGLFNGAIPMVAIQLSALRVGDGIVLDFVSVMDRFALRRDEETESLPQSADRGYWEGKASHATLAIADECLQIMNERAQQQMQLNYTLFYIGLRIGARSTAFVRFQPMRKFTHIVVSVDAPSLWIPRFEEAGLEAAIDRADHLRVTVSPGDEVRTHEALLRDLLHSALTEYER